MGTPQGRETAGAAAAPTTTPTEVRRLVRSADQLDIVVELVDARLDGDTVVQDGPEPRLRLTFGPQHVGEETFDDDDPVPPTSGVGQVAAGPSVVVVPVDVPFPFTVDGILAAAEATAGLAGLASEGAPDGTVTAVEAPAGLWLSPASAARLAAPRLPVVAGPTAEVWTARVEPAGGAPGPVELAAIQARPDDLFDTRVPTAAQRGDIVKNSTNDAPLTARRLWLSSAGAAADLHGEWDAVLALYDHAIAAGRDVTVKVESLGYLLPFGHRAAIAETTERVIVDDAGGGQTAALRVESFLTIVEPTVTTPRAGARNDGRGLPLLRLTATTSETTPIELVAVIDGGGAIPGVHDVVAAGADLVVDYRGTDRGGAPVSFSLPATFIDDEFAHATGAGDAPARARAVAAGGARLARREVDLGGQRVAYADPVGGAQPSRATRRFRLAWEGPDDGTSEDDLAGARSPAVFGVLEDADVVHEQVGSATGATGATVTATHHRRWLDHGNDADNFDLAFLDLAEKVSSLVGGDSPVGGVAQLDLIAEVFNQLTGGGPDLAEPGDFTVDQLLGDTSRIIADIALSAVIDLIESSLPGTEITIDGSTVTVEYTFCPTLHDLDEVGFRTDPGKTRCCLHVTTVASLDDTVEASFETELRLENFFLDFPPGLPTPAVTVDFASLVGTISSDGSSEIVPSIRSWDFTGTISMLMALVDKLGLADVDLKVIGDVVDMDSSINVPDIPLGVAELKNFSINLGLDLPLGEGDGRLAVGIGRRSSPLDIDVLMFGATFWLDVSLGFNGKQPPSTTTSLGVSVYWEMLDFDIFVAHASFTLRLAADWKLAGGEVTFTGAVSLEGEVDVLGLVSVSASIVASLTYESATEVMVLKGTVNYCVDTFLGKAAGGSVPIGRQEIEMGDGQGNDLAARALTAGPSRADAGPSFQDRYPEPVWDEYCDAFAA